VQALGPLHADRNLFPTVNGLGCRFIAEATDAVTLQITPRII
jgi:hypothetical protein